MPTGYSSLAEDVNRPMCVHNHPHVTDLGAATPTIRSGHSDRVCRATPGHAVVFCGRGALACHGAAMVQPWLPPRCGNATARRRSHMVGSRHRTPVGLMTLAML